MDTGLDFVGGSPRTLKPKAADFTYQQIHWQLLTQPIHDNFFEWTENMIKHNLQHAQRNMLPNRDEEQVSSLCRSA